MTVFAISPAMPPANIPSTGVALIEFRKTGETSLPLSVGILSVAISAQHQWNCVIGETRRAVRENVSNAKPKVFYFTLQKTLYDKAMPHESFNKERR